jgi:hypothetical protein
MRTELRIWREQEKMKAGSREGCQGNGGSLDHTDVGFIRGAGANGDKIKKKYECARVISRDNKQRPRSSGATMESGSQPYAQGGTRMSGDNGR